MSSILVKKSDGTQVRMTMEEFKLYKENLKKNPQNNINQTVVQKDEKEKILPSREENIQPISQSVVESSEDEEVLWSGLDEIKEEPVLGREDRIISEESDLPMIPLENSLANTTPVKDIFVDEAMYNKTKKQEDKKILKQENIGSKKSTIKQTIKSEDEINLEWKKEDNKSLLEEDDEEIKKHHGYTVLPASKNDLVDKILAELSFTILEELFGRAQSLVLSRIKDIRTDEQVLEYAMREKEAGGLNLSKEQANDLLISIKKHLGLKNEMKKVNKAEENLVKKSLSEVISESKSSLTKPKIVIGQKPILHDVILPKVEVNNISNKITETSKKSVGPLDELKTFDLRDWRRLSNNPVKAGEELIEKFMVLKNESFLSFMQGVEAWRQSPLYFMYKDIISTSILSQQKIKDYLFNQDKNNILSSEEFDQLVKVNKNLV